MAFFTFQPRCTLPYSYSFEDKKKNYINFGKVLDEQKRSPGFQQSRVAWNLHWAHPKFFLPGEPTAQLIQKKNKKKKKREKCRSAEKKSVVQKTGSVSLFGTKIRSSILNCRSHTVQTSYPTRCSSGERAGLSVRHLTSGNNKHSCQAADYLLPSTFNTQQLHCCEQITDHFKVTTAVWTVIISSDRRSPVESSHILQGCCGEADTST